MARLSPEQKQIRDRCVVNVVDFDWWLGEKGWGWQGLESGAYGITLQEAELLYVWEDPVLWGAAFLDDPNSPGDPYVLWDYQEPSARAWHQDCVHCDGAEVGKTREIILLTLWGMGTGFGFSVRLPSMLIGAPQQTHLDEIIMAIEETVGVSDGLENKDAILRQFWLKPKKQPHYLMRFANTNPYTGKTGIGRVYFRPAGHDGVAFRGVHVNAMAIMDEAAKLPNQTCWDEFRRAQMPGCIERMYSVPDGRRDTEFYLASMRAVPNLAPDRDGVRLFHWPKTLMPDPFWNEKRDRELRKKYRGIKSAGYQRNVLGNHGDPADSVFTWHDLSRSLRNVPEHTTLKLIADADAGELSIEALKFDLEVAEGGGKVSHDQWLADRHESLATYTDNDDRAGVRDAVRDLLGQFFSPPTTPADLYFGGDLGYSNDPTELMIWQRVGKMLRRVGRVHLTGAGYELQCEIIYCLDEIFGFSGRWGIDLGSAGIVVVQMMHSLDIYNDGNYPDRMFGFQFSEVVDATDEDGNVIVQEKNGKEKIERLPFKQIATDLWLQRYQGRGVEQVYDPEVLEHYTNHTATQGQRHLIYDKKNDHTIDADRVAMLAKVYGEDRVVDVFAGGAYQRGAA